jgi:hypothetical protein
MNRDEVLALSAQRVNWLIWIWTREKQEQATPATELANLSKVTM